MFTGLGTDSAVARRTTTPTKVISLAVTAAIGVAGCVQLDSRVAHDADLAAIAAFNKRYLRAINDGDFTTLSGMTTVDHIMMAPNRPAIVGKRANDEANGRAFGQFRFSEQWVPLDTVIEGDLAYQRGTFTTAAIPKQGGRRRSFAGKFLRIYRRLPDGSWSMVIDMFNSDAPEATR